MKEVLACSKCNAEKIMRGRIPDRGDSNIGFGDLAVLVYEDPKALVFKGAHKGTLYAQICGECGYAEIYLENPQELYAVYQSKKSKGKKKA